MRLTRLALVLAVLLVALTVPSAALELPTPGTGWSLWRAPSIAEAQGGPNRAGIVVRFEDGHTVSRCVDYSEAQISGFDLLRKSGLNVASATSGGLGSAVCKIEGVGCDPSSCLTCTSSPIKYWAYFQLRDGAWTYSQVGAGGSQVRPGTLEGWSFGATAVAPPLVPFQQVCTGGGPAAATATATSPAVRPTDTPAAAPAQRVGAAPLPIATIAPLAAPPAATSTPTQPTQTAVAAPTQAVASPSPASAAADGGSSASNSPAAASPSVAANPLASDTAATNGATRQVTDAGTPAPGSNATGGAATADNPQATATSAPQAAMTTVALGASPPTAVVVIGLPTLAATEAPQAAVPGASSGPGSVPATPTFATATRIAATPLAIPISEARTPHSAEPTSAVPRTGDGDSRPQVGAVTTPVEAVATVETGALGVVATKAAAPAPAGSPVAIASGAPISGGALGLPGLTLGHLVFGAVSLGLIGYLALTGFRPR